MFVLVNWKATYAYQNATPAYPAVTNRWVQTNLIFKFIFDVLFHTFTEFPGNNTQSLVKVWNFIHSLLLKYGISNSIETLEIL